MGSESPQQPQHPILWALAALVVVGAGIGSYLLQPDPPEEYRASAVVAPPTSARESAATLNLFVNDLPERVYSDGMVVHVLDQVPELDEDDYLGSVVSRRLEASSFLEISFTHADRALAQETVETVARRIVEESARGDYDRAAYLLDQAEDRVDRAEAELLSFTTAEGVFDPGTEYANVLDQIASIDRQIMSATLEELDESVLETLRDEQEDLIRQRDRYRSILPTFEGLHTELDRAREELEMARSQYVEAEFEYSSENSPQKLIVARDVELVVDQTSRLQQAALAAAVAFILAVFVLMPIGRWLARRRPNGKHQRPDVDEPTVYDFSVDSASERSQLVNERR